MTKHETNTTAVIKTNSNPDQPSEPRTSTQKQGVYTSLQTNRTNPQLSNSTKPTRTSNGYSYTNINKKIEDEQFFKDIIMKQTTIIAFRIPVYYKTLYDHIPHFYKARVKEALCGFIEAIYNAYKNNDMMSETLTPMHGRPIVVNINITEAKAEAKAEAEANPEIHIELKVTLRQVEEKIKELIDLVQGYKKVAHGLYEKTRLDNIDRRLRVILETIKRRN